MNKVQEVVERWEQAVVQKVYCSKPLDVEDMLYRNFAREILEAVKEELFVVQGEAHNRVQTKLDKIIDSLK